ALYAERAVLGQQPGGPAVLVAASRPADAAGWAADLRAELGGLLERHKAVLLRGFGIDTVERFRLVLAGLGADLLEYTERSTPRPPVGARIYTSTEYPRSDEIPLHNESSYSPSWPRRLHFCCLQPASQGGATSIADSRRVFQALDPGIVEAFLDKGVLYVRNY